jgi:hypothetical protein
MVIAYRYSDLIEDLAHNLDYGNDASMTLRDITAILDNLADEYVEHGADRHVIIDAVEDYIEIWDYSITMSPYLTFKPIMDVLDIGFRYGTHGDVVEYYR